ATAPNPYHPAPQTCGRQLPSRLIALRCVDQTIPSADRALAHRVEALRNLQPAGKAMRGRASRSVTRTRADTDRRLPAVRPATARPAQVPTTQSTGTSHRDTSS